MDRNQRRRWWRASARRLAQWQLPRRSTPTMPEDDPSGTPESLAAPRATEAHHARYPVEAAYTRPGPYATTTSAVTDGAGNAIYDLYYPADYAALGFKSPIVTWGNGTLGIPTQYSTLLGHLASHGFTSSARPRRKPAVASRS